MTICSALPPAFSIFSFAEAENLCALTETGLVNSPSPRILRPSLRPLTAPASTSLSRSTSARPSVSRPPTLTSAYSIRNGLVNPRLGTGRWMGIWPPSKPMKFMLPVRAFWPLPPRPAVLPVPLACPRPTRFFSFTPPPAGGVNLVNSFMSLLRPGLGRTALQFCHRAATEGLEWLLRLGPLDQVRDDVDHAADGRRVLQDAFAPDTGQTQPPQGRAVLLGVPAHAADQLHFDGHL